jgi:hypothetical protein
LADGFLLYLGLGVHGALVRSQYLLFSQQDFACYHHQPDIVTASREPIAFP